jgi:hypothetical protein
MQGNPLQQQTLAKKEKEKGLLTCRRREQPDAAYHQ